jgi:probable HAF family extracellular repeat protein
VISFGKRFSSSKTPKNEGEKAPLGIGVGQVVGVSDIKENAHFDGFLWTTETGMPNLGTLHTDDVGSSATGLDERGDVVGLSINASGTPHAFLRLNGEEMIDLHTVIPTDSPSFLHQACSINSRGESSLTWP